MKFYADCSYTKEETVRLNLKNLGYGNDLTKFTISQDYVNSCILKSQNLPRSILSSNKKYFDFLFDLLSIFFLIKNIELGGEISNITLGLIFKLPISYEKIENLVSVMQSPNFNWSQIFSYEKSYETMYLIFVIMTFLFDNSEGDLELIRREMRKEDKEKWVIGFLEKNGLLAIMEAVKILKEKLSMQIGGLNYLNVLLDLLNYCVMASLDTAKLIPESFSHYEYEQIYIPQEIQDGSDGERPKQENIQPMQISIFMNRAKKNRKNNIKIIDER